MIINLLLYHKKNLFTTYNLNIIPNFIPNFKTNQLLKIKNK